MHKKTQTDASAEISPHEQFVALFVRHEAAIHSFVLTMVPSLADADEVLQEASMTMWRRFDQYQPGTSFRNWAFQVAKYTAFNFVRKQTRDRHRFSDTVMTLLAEQAQQGQHDHESRRIALEHCLTRLDESEQTMLAAVYREGASIKSVAEKLGKTPNAIGKRLARIRKALLVCIRRAMATEGTA